VSIKGWVWKCAWTDSIVDMATTPSIWEPSTTHGRRHRSLSHTEVQSHPDNMGATMETLCLNKISSSNSTPIIQVDMSPDLCPYCRETFQPGRRSHLTMESVKAIEHGIETTGHVECPRCGVAIQTVRHEIELAASTFECPTCHRTETLRYDIESVTPRTGDLKDGFTFDVKVTCDRCTHKKSFKSVIKSILGVVTLRVGPDGVEVSKCKD